MALYGFPVRYQQKNEDRKDFGVHFERKEVAVARVQPVFQVSSEAAL